MPPEDAEENLSAIEYGNRILSSYYLNATERLWIITEADRSVTTLLLPKPEVQTTPNGKQGNRRTCQFDF